MSGCDDIGPGEWKHINGRWIFVGDNPHDHTQYLNKPTYYGKNDPYRFALDNNLGPLEMNAIKYIVRHTKKNGKEDIDKAIHTLERLKEELYGDS